MDEPRSPQPSTSYASLRGFDYQALSLSYTDHDAALYHYYGEQEDEFGNSWTESAPLSRLSNFCSDLYEVNNTGFLLIC